MKNSNKSTSSKKSSKKLHTEVVVEPLNPIVYQPQT